MKNQDSHANTHANADASAHDIAKEKPPQTYIAELFGLTGHVGIVTGASRGIGAGIADVLTRAGATVYNLSRTPPAESAANIHHLAVDLRDRDATRDAIDRIISSEGRLDFLVNNAGITHKQRAETFPPGQYQRILDINLSVAYDLSRICYPHLSQSPHIGRIVNISSMGAHMGFTGVTPYCMSKSGVLGLTRGLATEWAHDNILVNSVAPGWVLTDLNADMFRENPDRRKSAQNRIALERFGTPTDIAHMVLFLLGQGSSYLTGQDFAVDGGALGYGY